MIWGRESEIKVLKSWDKTTSKIGVIYGRRRVGKTFIVENAYKENEYLKFEGVEGAGRHQQMQQFLQVLADKFNRSELVFLKPKSWIFLFKLLSDLVGTSKLVLFFDEFQWLAGERTQVVSELKYAWDNYFLKNNCVQIILCGSISSFMVKKVLNSKALYGRIDFELHLQPLKMNEIKKYFTKKRSLKEVIDLYNVTGGVPQYLKMFDLNKSTHLNISQLCFTNNGYLVKEFDRIFASHFGKNKHYRDILLFLVKKHVANRSQLSIGCKIESGGRLAEYLLNLELAGFVEKFYPVDKPNSVRRCRYRVIDFYLVFYFNFIFENLKKIENSRPGQGFANFCPEAKYRIWQRFAFERFCLEHHHDIADALRFGGINYDAGSWYKKGEGDKKAQIDLMFIRADQVITICELKYTSVKIGKSVIPDIERKLEVFPNPKQCTIEKILISLAPPTRDLLDADYFNQILSIRDIW